MYKLCKTPQSIKRQKQFQDTLLSMMEKQNYQNITVTALCQEMDVPRKAFYRYFETLEDVLCAAIDVTLKQAYCYLFGEPQVKEFFSFWKKEKRFLDVLEKNGLSYKLSDRTYVMMVGDSVMADLTEKDIRYAGQITALITMLILWHHSGMKQTPEKMEQMVNHIFGRQF